MTPEPHLGYLHVMVLFFLELLEMTSTPVQARLEVDGKAAWHGESKNAL